jgi:hypothetical protein
MSERDDLPGWLWALVVLPYALVIGLVLRPLAKLGLRPVRRLLDRLGEGW